MTTQDDDLDRFRNSLAESLGVDMTARLSALEPERPFVGWEILATYGVFLFGLFGQAFIAEVKRRLEEEAKKQGKTLANTLVDALKKAAGRIKTAKPATVEEQRQTVAEVDAALREVTAYSEIQAAFAAAETAGKAKVVAELKGKGLPDAEAAKKAEKIVQTIMSRFRK